VPSGASKGPARRERRWPFEHGSQTIFWSLSERSSLPFSASRPLYDMTLADPFVVAGVKRVSNTRTSCSLFVLLLSRSCSYLSFLSSEPGRHRPPLCVVVSPRLLLCAHSTRGQSFAARETDQLPLLRGEPRRHHDVLRARMILTHAQTNASLLFYTSLFSLSQPHHR